MAIKVTRNEPLFTRTAEDELRILSRIHAEDGRTVVVTLHQVDVARRYCHRAVALKDGRLYFDGPINELTDERLQALYENADLDELRASEASNGEALPSDRRDRTPHTVVTPVLG